MQNEIKIERTRLGFTQAQLAERVGVSRQTIHSIEKGRYIPSTTLALKLARILERPVEQLFILEEGD